MLYSRFFVGPVAQLVEQRIENPRVGGSIPPQATRIQPQEIARFLGLFLFAGEMSFAAWDERRSGCEQASAAHDKIPLYQGLAACSSQVLFRFRSKASCSVKRSGGRSTV
ncbi:hypothetical protein BCAR13_60254 [Paraburkholderia caribensis]|nr:hypothetical protein BCAR13_60254 [Paraburkholderia caribensis]